MNDKISIVAIVAGIVLLVAALPQLTDYLEYKMGGRVAGKADDSGSIKIADEAIKTCSGRLYLNHGELSGCINSGGKNALLAGEQELADRYGVRGVPAFVVGCSYIFAGAYPPWFMDQAITLAASDEVLNETEFMDWCLTRASNKTCTRHVRVIGNETCRREGKILVLEFLDIVCPECHRAQNRTVPWLAGNEEIIFEQHHATHSKKSERLATAVECAADLGKEDEFRECLFDEIFSGRKWG